jgi:hypothetical protein
MKTVDEILAEHGAEEGEFTYSLKAALQALVEEALKELVGDMAEVTNYDLTKSAHKWLDEQNIWQNELRHAQLDKIPQVISKMFGDTK